MKKVFYGTFFGKPIYLELEDSDDEGWFKQRLESYQKQEMKEKEEYIELKTQKDLDYIMGRR